MEEFKQPGTHQNIDVTINYPSVVTSPQIPMMIRPNYERVPFINQHGILRNSATAYRTILNSGFPSPAHQNEETELYLLNPSIQPPSQWTPQSNPLINLNPDTVPNYDPHTNQLAHETPGIQISPELIAQAPLCSVISLPDDDKNVPVTAKPKKSALRRHNVKRNQKKGRGVHFSESVIERDEIKKRIARSKHQASNVKNKNLLMDTVAVENLHRQLSDEIANLHL